MPSGIPRGTASIAWAITGTATSGLIPEAAPLGPVPPEVVLATFYNFSPAAVLPNCTGLWEQASPAAFQAARFRVVQRALTRVGASLGADALAEARSIIDPVVAGLDLAGKPLAAANAAVALPADPLVALWQQLTIVREYRGDVHIALLVANVLYINQFPDVKADAGAGKRTMVVRLGTGAGFGTWTFRSYVGVSFRDVAAGDEEAPTHA